MVSGVAEEEMSGECCRRGTCPGRVVVPTPGGGQSRADTCIFISDHHACLVFSQNCSGCQGKGTGNLSGKDARGVKAEGRGGVLIQMWPGAAGAPAATPANAGV